jgi:hypothetical protein
MCVLRPQPEIIRLLSSELSYLHVSCEYFRISCYVTKHWEHVEVTLLKLEPSCSWGKTFSYQSCGFVWFLFKSGWWYFFQWIKVFDDGYAEVYILLKWRIPSPHNGFDSVLSIRLCVLTIVFIITATKQVWCQWSRLVCRICVVQILARTVAVLTPWFSSVPPGKFQVNT